MIAVASCPWAFHGHPAWLHLSEALWGGWISGFERCLSAFRRLSPSWPGILKLEATSPITQVFLPFLPAYIVGKQARRPIPQIYSNIMGLLCIHPVCHRWFSAQTIFKSNPCLFQVKDPQGKHKLNSVERTTLSKDTESHAFTIRYNHNRTVFCLQPFWRHCGRRPLTA